MEDRELAEKLLTGVAIENLATYRQIFTETSPVDATDLYWRDALSFFDKLNSEEKEVLFAIIKQISVDTISSVTGVLDGSTEIGLDEGINITSESGNRLSGSLQDYFLEAEENESQ